ncbi:MAG TPA: type II toxin-antitoxin system VapC family toxin [Dehalococcoidia bacterium]|nr:type II toxin-antitoxin system VapC family toxin [Dehalococcoidia bacterium]
MTLGLADTSVVIDFNDPELRSHLPDESSVSTITLAELASGTHIASDPAERAERQMRLQQTEGLFEVLNFDRACAQSYGQIVGATLAAGRSHRRRAIDLLIAAVAHANGLALYTRNPNDFVGLEDLISVVAV